MEETIKKSNMDVKIRFIVCFKSDPPNKKGGAPRGDPPQTVDKVGAGIIPSTTFLHIAILLSKILKNSRFPMF